MEGNPKTSEARREESRNRPNPYFSRTTNWSKSLSLHYPYRSSWSGTRGIFGSFEPIWRTVWDLSSAYWIFVTQQLPLLPSYLATYTHAPLVDKGGLRPQLREIRWHYTHISIIHVCMVGRYRSIDPHTPMILPLTKHIHTYVPERHGADIDHRQ